MRPHATDTLRPAPDSPFDNSLGKGTRLIDLEAFLPQFYKQTSCRSCVEARNKQNLQDFAAFYNGYLEGLGLWKRAEHKRPNPFDVWRCFVAERSAAGSPASYAFVPRQKLVKETPVGLAGESIGAMVQFENGSIIRSAQTVPNVTVQCTSEKSRCNKTAIFFA
jgi:hypothetical protein